MDEGKQSRCIICNCYTTTQQGYNIFSTKLEDGEILLSTFLKNVLDCSVLIVIPPDFYLCGRCFRLCSELDYSLERCNKLQQKIRSLFNISKANQEAYYNGAEPVELKDQLDEDEEIFYKRLKVDAGCGDPLEEDDPGGETVELIQSYLETVIGEDGTHLEEKDDATSNSSQLIEDGVFWPPNQEIFYEDGQPSEMTENGCETAEAETEVPTDVEDDTSVRFTDSHEGEALGDLELRRVVGTRDEAIKQDPLGMVWYCKPCKLKFNSLELLKVHKKSLSCQSNCKNFEIKSAYEYKHYTIKLKQKKKVFFCNYCTFEAFKAKTMDKHIESHKSDPYIMCDVCGRRYKNNRTFKKHMMTHDENRPFACKSCAFRSTTELTLRIHQKKHDEPKKYICSMCPYRSSMKLSYLNHLRTHTGERPYVCPNCPYRSKDSSTMVRHRRIHGGLKRYHCTNCDYKSAEKMALKRHMMVHTGEKPHTCPHCDYSSMMRCNLIDHIAAKHSTEKPWACDLCDYKAKVKRLLTYHMRIHSNEKPFPCTLCNFRGRHRGSLAYHMKSKHRPSTKGDPVDNYRFVHFSSDNIEFSDEEVEYELIIDDDNTNGT